MYYTVCVYLFNFKDCTFPRLICAIFPFSGGGQREETRSYARLYTIKTLTTRKYYICAMWRPTRERVSTFSWWHQRAANETLRCSGSPALAG